MALQSTAVFFAIVIAIGSCQPASNQCVQPLPNDDVSLLQSSVSASVQRPLRSASINIAATTGSASNNLDMFNGTATGLSEAWWAQQPAPWLTWQVLLGSWGVSVGLFFAVQLIMVMHKPVLIDGTSAGKLDKLTLTQEQPQIRRSSSSNLYCMALTWANPMFALGAGKLDPQSLQTMSPLHMHDDAAKACDQFQCCWSREVKYKGLHAANLISALMQFIGFYQLFKNLCLIFACFVANSFIMLHALELLLGYFSWLRPTTGMVRTPDPFYSCLLVVSLCFFLPVSGALLGSLVKVKDGHLSAQLLAALTSAVHDKAQRLPSSESCTGQDCQETHQEQPDIIHLVNVDIGEATQDLVRTGLLCFAAPVNVLLLILMLWWKIGMAVLLAGIGILPLAVLTYPLIQQLTNARIRYQSAATHRLGWIANFLNGIHAVKHNAWEESLSKKVEDARQEELRSLWVFHQNGQHIATFGSAWPRVVMLMVFACYTWLNPIVDRTIVFVGVLGLSYIAFYLSVALSSFSKLASMKASIGRVETFLRLPEKAVARCKKPQMKESKGGSPTVVQLHGSFAWQQGLQPVLTRLNVSISQGSLVAVIGRPGAGKTALLHAMMGEMNAVDGAEVMRPSSAGYSSRTPWVCSGTVRSNVLLGNPFNSDRYSSAVSSTNLWHEIESLPGGDLFCITPGAPPMLSSKQLACVSLARTAYSQEDLVLLDDPFSDFDDGAAEDLIERVLLNTLLKDRTRIVTMQPNPALLKRFDLILVLEQGCIVQRGSPKEVLQTNIFSKIRNEHEDTIRFSATKNTTSTAVMLAHERDKLEDWPMGLRDPEDEGLIHMSLFQHCLRIIGWGRFGAFVAIAMAIQLTIVHMYILMAGWFSRGSNPYTSNALLKNWQTMNYAPLNAIAAVWCLSVVLGVMQDVVGATCSQKLSSWMHRALLQSVLRSPAEKLIKTPTLNAIKACFTEHIYKVDMSLWFRMSAFTSVMCGLFCPILYVHATVRVLPLLLALPCYATAAAFLAVFFRVLPRLRHLCAMQKQEISNKIFSAMQGKVLLRASGRCLQAATVQSESLSSFAHTRFMLFSVAQQWLCIRLSVCFSAVYALVATSIVMNPLLVDEATFGIILVFCTVALQSWDLGLEAYLTMLLDLAPVGKFQEATELPGETPSSGLLKPLTDERVVVTAELNCASVTPLQLNTSNDGMLQILSHAGDVLFQSLGNDAQDLAPTNMVLHMMDLTGSHTREQLIKVSADMDLCIACMDDFVGNANELATMLCKATSKVHFEIRGAWWTDGTRVTIQNLPICSPGAVEKVICHTSLDCARRQKMVITGSIASSMSQLLLSIVRVASPSQGHIFLDGVDIANVDLKELRKIVGFIPRETVIFRGSLRYNLDPTQRCSDEELVQALRLAHLGTLVHNLSTELQSRTGGTGRVLSRQERQLLSVARVALRQPCLLLVDDPFLLLQGQARRKLQDLLCSLFARCTMISVTQCFEALHGCDRIMVHDSGELVEVGSTAELFKRLGGGHVTG